MPHKSCKNCRCNDRLIWRLCPSPASGLMSRQAEVTLPFQGAREQIGDASAGTDHLRAIVGPAAERHFDRAGIRAAGGGGADLARWPDPDAAESDAGVTAGCEPAADRRRCRAVVSRP